MKKKVIKQCRHCKHFINVDDSQRKVDNIMGGCFLGGIFITTDSNACSNFKERKEE